MAKVKIQGNASGTGVITLTAPNTSTDRTVTLPDADVTLGTDATKLPLAGGTLTGNLLVQSASTGATASTDANDLVIEGTNGGISILNATSGQGNIFFGDSGDNDIGKIAYNHTANTMYFITNGGVRTSLTPDGLTFNGDTAAANALDDYEEGTWTPAASGGASSAAGTYTKVGRLVTCNGTLTFPSQTNSGRATVEGLPFTSLNVDHGFTGTIRYTNYDPKQLMIHGDNNATTFGLYEVAYGSAVTTATWTEISGKRFDFSLMYFV